jgi:uncharacterized membrane protein YagU involved in acid resistance
MPSRQKLICLLSAAVRLSLAVDLQVCTAGAAPPIHAQKHDHCELGVAPHVSFSLVRVFRFISFIHIYSELRLFQSVNAFIFYEHKWQLASMPNASSASQMQSPAMIHQDILAIYSRILRFSR